MYNVIITITPYGTQRLIGWFIAYRRETEFDAIHTATEFNNTKGMYRSVQLQSLISDMQDLYPNTVLTIQAHVEFEEC